MVLVAGSVVTLAGLGIAGIGPIWLIFAPLLPNPVVQVIFFVEGGAGALSASRPIRELDYDWPGRRIDTAGETTGLMATNMIGHSLAGLLLFCLGWARLRRNVF